MIINKLLKIILLILGITYIVLEVFQVELYNDFVSSTLLVLFTLLYSRNITTKNKKRPYFLYFLITFTISELLSLFSNFFVLITDTVDYNYYSQSGYALL